MRTPSKDLFDTVHAGAKALAGVQTLSGPVVVYRGRTGAAGSVEVRLELETERCGDAAMVRLRSVQQRGLSIQSSGAAWAVADLQRPDALVALLERVVEAARPGQPVHDPRGALGRLFDRLLGHTHVNAIPLLGQQTHPFPQTLSAVIHRVAGQTWVSLRFARPHRGTTGIYIPLDGVQALIRHLRDRAGDARA